MVAPSDVLKLISIALENAEGRNTLLLRAYDDSNDEYYEPDHSRYIDGEGYTISIGQPDMDEGSLKLPLINIQNNGVQVAREMNTDQCGVIVKNTTSGEEYLVNDLNYRANDDEELQSTYFQSPYTMRVQIDIWVVDDSSWVLDEAVKRVRQELKRYESFGPGVKFENRAGNPMRTIHDFELEEGRRTDDITYTDTVRRWTQDITVRAFETFEERIDYITNVTYPSHRDMGSTSALIESESTEENTGS